MNFDLLINKKAKYLLWIIFGGSILSKIFIIPFLGATWFPYSDEHLYIELAKNIYYHHNLVSNVFNHINQYNEILYPLLLSPLYIFYSPENILTIFRIFGLIAMSCSVFPAYKLSLVILKDIKQALIISIFTVLIPEMTLAFSVIQEVIYYPLFLFTIYLIYQKICGKKISTVFLGFVLFLLWSCKAIGLSIFVGYILYLICDLIFIDKFIHYKNYIIHILIVAAVVLSLRELLTLVIGYVNFGNFASRNDYYTSSIVSKLGVMISKFISDFPNGILYYLFFISIIFMVFPLVIPFDNFYQYELSDKKFLLFYTISFVITITIIVVIIYMNNK